MSAFIHNRRHIFHVLNSDLALRFTSSYANRLKRVQDPADAPQSIEIPDEEREISSQGDTGSEELLDFSYAGRKHSTTVPDPDIEVEAARTEFEPIVSRVRNVFGPQDQNVLEGDKEESRKDQVKGFTDWIRKVEDETPQDAEVQDDLIAKFINGGHGPIRADKQTELSGDVSTNSIEEDESYITDTLAKIYVRQGLYSKAIYAYEKLSLKYPEKSSYFATQIEEIKQLINNK